MSKLSVDISASARNGVSRILHGLDISNQKEIAEHLKVDPSTITRLKTDKKNNGLNEIEMFDTIMLSEEIIDIIEKKTIRKIINKYFYLTINYILFPCQEQNYFFIFYFGLR